MTDEKLDMQWLNRGFHLSQFDAVKMVKRDRLISTMLQDRGVLRLIVAPHGYGKSLLAYQYAQRMFSTGKVLWIDGSSPEFVCALDKGRLTTDSEDPVSDADLVVIDALSRLDETRRLSITACIDRLLIDDVEVVVTTLPSLDFLQEYQPDRIRITAADLLVKERDIKIVMATGLDKDLAIAREHWRIAGGKLFGTAPCSVWGAGDELRYQCLAGFFEEQLPQEMFNTAFAMLLLKKGTYRDLESVGAGMRQETEAMMSQDYPFLGMDPIKQEFNLGEASLESIRDAMEQTQSGAMLLKTKSPLYERCIEVLINRSETQKAAEVLKVFCNAQQREAWLGERGLSLLDRGEVGMVETQFSQLGQDVMESNASLLMVRAWTCGISGDSQEASYYAEKAARYAEEAQADDPESRRVAVMAHLALMAFSQDGPFAWGKNTFAPDIIETPMDFLAAVIDLCDEQEIHKALGVLEGKFAPSALVTNKRMPKASKEKVEALEMLFTAHADRFQNTAAFRVAHHLLASVNGDRLRQMVRDIGGVMLIPVRKSGIKSFTQSILVSDLWRCGFFGVGGTMADVRESRLLDSASAYFTRLARLADKEPGVMPWNVDTATPTASGKVKSAGNARKSRVSVKDKMPIANVTLFGGLEVVVGDKYIPGNKFSRRALQLFSILVMYQGRDVSRQVLLDHMWPGLDKTRALDNFYTAWSRAVALVGADPYMIRRGDFCSVSLRYVHSDIAEFDQLVRRLLTERDDVSMMLDIYARMESLYRGGLLPSEQGNAYIDAQRLRYKSTFVDGMVAAASRSLDVNDARIALWFARKAMEEDPKREDVYFAMIRAQMASGQRCSAIRTYFRCREYLKEELGLDPSHETQSLYDELISSDPSLLRLEPTSFKS